MTEKGGQALMVLKLRAFDPQPEGLPEAQPMSYEGESTGNRKARRTERWRPVLPCGSQLGRIGGVADVTDYVVSLVVTQAEILD